MAHDSNHPHSLSHDLHLNSRDLAQVKPTKSCTVSSTISEDRNRIVSLIATVPIVLFQRKLAKLDLKVRT